MSATKGHQSSAAPSPHPPTLKKRWVTAIRSAKPAVRVEICVCIYVSQVVEDHLPIFIMVLSSTPASFRAMAPPARSECALILSTVYPQWYNPVRRAACRMAEVMSRAVICRPAPKRLIGVGGGAWISIISWTIFARHLTGQKEPTQAEWCMVLPRCPFFWLSTKRVAPSAVSSNSKGAVWSMRVPFFQSRMSCRRNCTVRVRLLAEGIQYSPERSK